MNYIQIINKNTRLIIASLVMLGLVSSCKRFIEVPAPSTSITEGNVFSNDQTAIAVVTGLYDRISLGSYGEPQFIALSKLAGLSADELDLWSGALDVERAYYQNDLQTHFRGPTGSVEAGAEFWKWIYPMIYSANQSLVNLEKSTSLTPDVKQQLIGECKFYRGFLYFYLVNLYGEVPIALDISPEVNSKLPRSSVTLVYAQIIKDLQDAKSLLSDDFVNMNLQPYGSSGNEERTRPNRWAATAMLARVWLYSGDYSNAALAATEVINKTNLFDLAGVALTDVFKKNSREAIWQLQPVQSGWNTTEGRMFNLNAEPVGFDLSPNSPVIKTVYLSSSLMDAFEPGDNRRTQWVDSYTSGDVFYFPSKYKDAGPNPDISGGTGAMTEYSMVLRLAEQYLIRAEAKVHNGDLPGAIADVNVVRTRARAVPTVEVPDPLPNLPSNLLEQQVLDAIWKEKRMELFTEWGHRWLDLKRDGQVNTVMPSITSLKGGTWENYQAFYPLPATDLHYAPQLTQNTGYQN